MAAQEQPHRAYAEIIERDYPGRRYRWFVQMLREGYNKGYGGKGCTIHVVDHDNDQVIAKKFDLLRDSDVTTEFEETLARPLSDSGVRFVVVDYGELDDLNFSYVDHIASTAKLEPSFLFAYFEQVRGQFEPTFRERAPALLPSDTRHLEFLYPVDFHEYKTMAVTQSVSYTTQGKFIIIFKKKPWNGKEDCPLASFLNGLSQPRIQDFSVQERLSPVEYLVPFLRAWVVEHATNIACMDGATEDVKLTPDYLHLLWTNNRQCTKALESVVQNLSGFLVARQASSSGIVALLQDYNALLQRSKDQSQDLKAFIQQISALESIRESQRGVQSADSVRRLTVVAFVFIPLTFATSFFGMNVRQLGTGGTDMGYFVLTAVAAGCLSLCLAFGLRPWERVVAQRKERIAWDRIEEVRNISFADVVHETNLGQRVLQTLDPSWNSTNFHTAFMVWAKDHFHEFRVWATSFRKRPHRDEDTMNRNSRELAPIA